jgi:phosphoribosylanthranilate isomerase
MTGIKICGLTRASDVELACDLGAAYVGFNFSTLSPRCVTLDRARDIARATRPGVSRVGVFVQESAGEIGAAAEAAGLDLVQIHRPLSARDLQRSPLPVIAVVAVSSDGAGEMAPELLARCRSVLCDTSRPGLPGGTGTTFDWNRLAGKTWPVPLILAGGLTPENVAEAIARVRPSAVDVASGVESSPGIKDEDKMRCFFDAVKRADALHPPPGEGRGEGAR